MNAYIVDFENIIIDIINHVLYCDHRRPSAGSATAWHASQHEQADCLVAANERRSRAALPGRQPAAVRQVDWRVRWPRRGRVRNLSRGALAPCSRGGVAGSANTSRNDCRIRRCDTHKHDVPACMCAHKNAHTNTRAPTYARTIYATMMISRALSSAIHACLCA